MFEMSLESLTRQKRIFLVSGSMGTGKTVLARKINSLQNKKTEILDDFSYDFDYEKAMKRRRDLISEISQMSHTEKKFIICVNRFPRLIMTMILQDPTLKDKIAYLFTSVHMEFFREYPITVPLRTFNKFRRSYELAMTKRRKTRPYLLVTTDDIKIGRYSHVK